MYFERRDRQFAGKDIPAIRVFPLNQAVKCVSAVFFRRPDLSYRYPKSMYEQLGNKIFADDIREVVFYTACLVLYRFNLLASNAEIPSSVRKYKWHIITLTVALVAGKVIPKLNNKKIETYCNKVTVAFSKHDSNVVDVFKKAADIVLGLDGLSDDKMKRQTTLDDLLSKV